MQYVNFGSAGVKVSRVALGLGLRGQHDEKEARNLVAATLDLGVNLFDCANIYGLGDDRAFRGTSEVLLGKALQGRRDDAVITSKVRGEIGDGPNDSGLSRYHILREAERSLRRLNTDRIDVYLIHGLDETTPVEETFGALDSLVQQGKVRYVGICNHQAWQVMKAQGIAARAGLARIECLQPMYNLVKRQAEVEILPMAANEEIGVIPYSPLGGGLLTGKYAADGKADAGRLIENRMYSKRYGVADYYQSAADFAAHARERGTQPATLAVAWVMAHPAITAPIIGARNLAQLDASLAALDVAMTPEWYDEISALSPSPPPAHDRLEEVG